MDSQKYSIVVVEPESIDNYMPDRPDYWNSLIPAHKSDLLRLHLLNKYGGVWMDATIYLTEPLDWIVNGQQNQVVGFKPHDDIIFIQNWFLVSLVPGNNLIRQWSKNLHEMFADPDHPGHACNCRGTEDKKSYYGAYLAFCYTLQHHPDLESLLKAVSPEPGTFFGDSIKSYFAPLRMQARLIKFTTGGRVAYKFRFVPLIATIFIFMVLVSLVPLIYIRLKIHK